VARATEDNDTSGDDEVLLARARAGSDEDYGLLFERHRAMAVRFARSKLSDPPDADDVVAEVFASVLATIRRGGGPVDVFVPYLMTSVRNECKRVNQQHVHQLAVAVKEHTASTGHVPNVHADAGEAEIVRDAFQSLPPKFQDVLWRVEVNEEPYDSLAARYRTTTSAVAMLTMRARRALASAYLDRHRPLPQPGQGTDKACRVVAHDLAGFTRGTLSSRRRHKVEAHLAHCDSCRRTHADLGRINQHLRLLPIAPLALLGDTAATGTKAGIQSYLSTCWAAAAPVVTSSVAAVALVSPVLLSGSSADRSIATAASDQPSEPVEDTNSQPAAPTGSPSPTTATPATSAETAITTSAFTTSAAPTSNVGPAVTVTAVTTPGFAGGSPTPTSAPRRTLPSVTTPALTTPGLAIPPLTVPITIGATTTLPVTVPPVTGPPVTVILSPPTEPPVTVPEPAPPTALPTPILPVTTTLDTTPPAPP